MAELSIRKTAWEKGLAGIEDRAVTSVRAFSPPDASRWDQFVHNEPSASFFHLSGWMRAIERTFDYSSCAILAERDGHITGVLPLYSIKNWVLGRCLISTPLAVSGGIAAADQESYDALLAQAKDMARQQQVEYLELRNTKGRLEPGFHPNTRYVNFSCDLVRDPETNLKRLPRDTRYMIRKAQKQGLEVRHGVDLLDDFYELFALSMRRLGTPVFPNALLNNLIAEFPGQTDLLMVYSGNKAVSGVLTFLFRDMVLPYYSGASPEAPRLAANNLMYWELMQWAGERGYRTFDFGRSKTGTGAYAFKTQWNMKIAPLSYQVFLVKKKTLPDFSPANPRFTRATQWWSRLPLWLTKKVGPRVIKWFP